MFNLFRSTDNLSNSGRYSGSRVARTPNSKSTGDFTVNQKRARNFSTTTINPASETAYVNKLKEEALKHRIHPETFYSTEGLTNCLLNGAEGLRLFSQSHSQTETGTGVKGFLLTVFNMFLNHKSPENSLLKKFYFSTHDENQSDTAHVGEPWEHFQKALSSNHYQIMPIYSKDSKDLFDPIAFTVFERSEIGESKSSLFKKLSGGSSAANNLKTSHVYFLDKVITNGFDKRVDMNAVQRASVEAFLNLHSRNAILMVPWQADAVEKTSRTILKGINHIGFTKQGSSLVITPRHIVEGQEYQNIKATGIFTRSPRTFTNEELKELVALQTMSEISAGPTMRLSDKQNLKKIQDLLTESFSSIDKAFPRDGSASGFALNPFKLLAGFFK